MCRTIVQPHVKFLLYIKPYPVATKVMLQRILEFSHCIAAEQYDDDVSALQCTIPQKLKTLISLSEQVPFSMPVRNIVNERIITAYKETLLNIEIFTRHGDFSHASDIICDVKCEIEIARLFFEGIYKYICNCDS